MRTRLRLAVLGAITAAAISGCARPDAGVVRGKGLAAATLSADAQAAVYGAAVRGAFDPDPSLSLLLDARLLPRTIGLDTAGRLSDSVAAAMRRRGITRGSCEPALGTKGVPLCKADLPGYIVRFSPVFALGPDSVQVYVYVQKYDVPGGEPSQTLRFERAYQVVHRGDDWTAVREGRVPKEARGEGKATP